MCNLPEMHGWPSSVKMLLKTFVLNIGEPGFNPLIWKEMDSDLLLMWILGGSEGSD